MEIEIKYKVGHTYKEPWVKTDYFCPLCGEREIWKCDDGGDYYQGEQHLCIKCGADFNLPNAARVSTDEYDLQRLQLLRDGAIK